MVSCSNSSATRSENDQRTVRKACEMLQTMPNTTVCARHNPKLQHDYHIGITCLMVGHQIKNNDCLPRSIDIMWSNIKSRDRVEYEGETPSPSSSTRLNYWLNFRPESSRAFGSLHRRGLAGYADRSHCNLNRAQLWLFDTAVSSSSAFNSQRHLSSRPGPHSRHVRADRWASSL